MASGIECHGEVPNDPSGDTRRRRGQRHVTTSAGARFVNGKLADREEDQQSVTPSVETAA
jgi:hypothetical protein